jgi:hypothetical protein
MESGGAGDPSPEIRRQVRAGGARTHVVGGRLLHLLSIPAANFHGPSPPPRDYTPYGWPLLPAAMRSSDPPVSRSDDGGRSAPVPLQSKGQGFEMSPPWELMALAAEGRDVAAAVPCRAPPIGALRRPPSVRLPWRTGSHGNEQRSEVEDDQDVDPTCHCKGR